MKEKYKNKEFKEQLNYMSYIHRLANNRIKEEYTNSGATKAAIVFNELFSNSNKIFRLYAGNLKGEISSNILYLSGLRQFLSKKNTELKILLEDLNVLPRNIQLFNLLKEYNSKVKLKRSAVFPVYKEVGNDEEDKSYIKIHFSVGDNSMYRVEIDKNNFKARGSFNNENEAQKLNQLFDRIFDNKSTNVDLMSLDVSN